MFKVKISTPDYKWPLIRQTPGQKGIWGDYEFIINEDIEECDYWVVYEGLEHKENVYCYPENIFLTTGEPPSVKKYNKNFLQQFFGVITSHTEIEHSRRFYTQQALPWMVGGRYLAKEKTWDEHFSKDYDELSNINGSIQKIKLMSMVCSNKDFTSGHSQRMQFVKKLSKHFGSDIDIFGVGIKNIEDKWDAIATYKYHIVVENCAINNYFSEKLSDSFLASTYPLYYGCPNITEYFPADSLSTINISESSTLSNFDILIKHSTSGWLELVHHFEMVVLSFPSCSASHKPVFFFSTSNSFRRFNSLCVIIFNLYRKITNYYQQTCKTALILCYVLNKLKTIQ